MARFILRPRSQQGLSSVSLSTTRLSSRARKKQLKVVKKIRDELDISKTLIKWVKDKRDKIKRVSDRFNMPATGTSIVDMSHDDAQSLRSEIPGVQVIEDRPLNLIAPIRSTANVSRVEDTDLWHLDAVGLSTARSRGFTGSGDGVTVAVLDTGVDSAHQEFTGKTISGVTFDVDAWAANVQTPSQDTEGHGTHVAGLIIGRSVGIAPGANIIDEVMIPNGTGMLSNFVLALEWSAAQPEISIVNMSAGIPGFVSGMEDAIDDLMAVGVVPIIATGNEGRNFARSPGNYNPVLSVGASNVHGAVASFSSSGTFTVNNRVYSIPDLVAPGEGVTSCVMTGGYESWNGTSMATPVVSGIAALILEKHPDISVLDLMDLLIDTCQDLGVSPERQGAGVVQIDAALANTPDAVVGTSTRASRPTKVSASRRTKKKATKKKKATRTAASKKKRTKKTKKKTRKVSASPRKKSKRKVSKKSGQRKRGKRKASKKRKKSRR